MATNADSTTSALRKKSRIKSIEYETVAVVGAET
jgi:hypothetical protein